jgi:V/A-type H+-transporting ATPase subunit C
MVMDYTIFASCIGRIKSLENKMLDRAKVESLVEAKDFEDSIRLLQDTRYGTYIGSSYEEGLKSALSDLYVDMYKTSPVREVVDILSVRYDGHNIKCLIKSKFAGFGPDRLLINAGTIDPHKLKDMIFEDDLRDMPKPIRPYVEEAIEGYKSTKDPQDIDITIDKGIFFYMNQIADGSGMEYLPIIVKMLIDITNIKSFIRIKLQDRNSQFFRKAFIEGGKLDFDLFGNNMGDSIENFPSKIAHTDYYKWVKAGIEEFSKSGELGTVEKHGDDYLIENLKKSELVSFGPEPVIAYILSVENEIRMLRIVLTGKKNDVPPDKIKERLRDLYV